MLDVHLDSATRVEPIGGNGGPCQVVELSKQWVLVRHVVADFMIGANSFYVIGHAVRTRFTLIRESWIPGNVSTLGFFSLNWLSILIQFLVLLQAQMSALFHTFGFVIVSSVEIHIVAHSVKFLPSLVRVYKILLNIGD